MDSQQNLMSSTSRQVLLPTPKQPHLQSNPPPTDLIKALTEFLNTYSTTTAMTIPTTTTTTTTTSYSVSGLYYDVKQLVSMDTAGSLCLSSLDYVIIIT